MNAHYAVTRIAVSLCVVGVALDVARAADVATQDFVGTTPGDDRSRAFLGGLPADAACHCMTWRLTLLGTENADEGGEYTLEVMYGLPGRDDPNQLVDGPTTKLSGRWDVVRGSKANPRGVVYRLHGAEEGQTVSLAKVSANLLHFLEDDGTLRVGNASWSYTLNRKREGRAN